MEICSLDWQALSGFLAAGATIVAARVAWNISEKWRDQKGSEEVSKECKELWYKLDELEKLYKMLDDLKELPLGLEYKSEIKPKIEIRKDFFSKVKEWTYSNLSKMEYVKILTDNDEEVVQSTYLLVDKLDSFYTQRLIQRFINDDDIKEFVNSKDILDNIDKVKKSLIPFIKFSKTV